MIKITDYKGNTHFVAHNAIAKLSETGASSQWHGIRCIVKLFDGSVIESGDTADHIASLIFNKEACDVNKHVELTAIKLKQNKINPGQL